MNVRGIMNLLSAQLLCGEDKLDMEVQTACGCDLMSDVLANVEAKTVLLTGLANAHVIRTAEMLDLTLVIFVRGKMPSEDVLKMAREKDIALLRCEYTLFNACGILYQHGIRGECRRDVS